MMRTNMERTGAHHHEGHHLWKAERDDGGRLKVRRERMEADVFTDVDEKKEAGRKEAFRKESSSKVAREEVFAYWGLFGADLVDDPTLNEEIPVSVSRRFNAAARNDAAPRVHTWDELRRAFGDEAVDFSRKAVAHGMKVRFASKYLNVPFMVAAEILTQLPDTDKIAIKQALDLIKTGRKVAAFQSHGPVARKVAVILDEYQDPSSHKIAIDEKAKAFWESYFGPYGAELVREIKKRVRADLASSWMRRNGVDAVAAEFWSRYFGAYGQRWVTVVPKKISPSKQ